MCERRHFSSWGGKLSALSLDVALVSATFLVDLMFFRDWSRWPLNVAAQSVGRCFLNVVADNPGNVVIYPSSNALSMVDGAGEKKQAWAKSMRSFGAVLSMMRLCIVSFSHGVSVGSGVWFSVGGSMCHIISCLLRVPRRIVSLSSWISKVEAVICTVHPASHSFPIESNGRDFSFGTR